MNNNLPIFHDDDDETMIILTMMMIIVMMMKIQLSPQIGSKSSLDFSNTSGTQSH